MTKKFAQLANWVAVMSGHPVVFGFAIFTVVAWMVTGPLFYFSDTWQFVMNTWTNVATFLMVFLIQNSQNRDSSAIQAKLDELIRTSAARNTLVGIERLTPEEIETIRKSVETLAREPNVRISSRKESAQFTLGLRQWHGTDAPPANCGNFALRAVDELAKLLRQLAMPLPRFVRGELCGNRQETLLVAGNMALQECHDMARSCHSGPFPRSKSIQPII
jgi:low affinity Fe/Cu permease